MICTFLDGIMITANLIALIIGLIWGRSDEYMWYNVVNSNSNNQNCEEDETPYYD